MREIKFRIWDTGKKRWFKGGTDNESRIFKTDAISLFGETITVGDILLDQNDDEFIHLDRIKDLVAVQFTGLKDKNGKEIYEGDILRVKADKEINGFIDYEWRYVVRFENGGFLANQVLVGGEKSGGSLIGRESVDRFEIIGNIHEHPELLK